MIKKWIGDYVNFITSCFRNTRAQIKFLLMWLQKIGQHGQQYGCIRELQLPGR